MANLNLNKKEWLQLVFEGKNKNYGAYTLRLENEKTTAKAFFGTVFLLAGISCIGLFLSSFKEVKPIVAPTIIDKTVFLVDLSVKPAIKKVEAQKVFKKSISKNLKNIKVVEKAIAPNVVITENINLNTTPSTNINESGATNSIGNENNTSPTNAVSGSNNTNSNPEGVVNTYALDKTPEFPGGISEFLKTVGKKFVTPELEEAKTIKILVFFIIEKDGSLSNIKVPKDPGFGLGTEAIRVLKSIVVKWEPGMVKGNPVRTLYSLPIIVKTE